MKSINWSHVKFDVLCIETDPSNRPPGYGALVTEYLAGRGYVVYAQQQGRNTCKWSLSCADCVGLYSTHAILLLEVTVTCRVMGCCETNAPCVRPIPGYTSTSFVPSTRPGLDPQCFNGARKCGKPKTFKRCPM